jgi:hypothetical protein
MTISLSGGAAGGTELATLSVQPGLAWEECLVRGTNSIWGFGWAFLILLPLILFAALGLWYFVPGPNSKGKQESAMGRMQ